LCSETRPNAKPETVTNKPKKETTVVILQLEKKDKMNSQRTNSTFASPNTQADSSACKRAISLPTHYSI
jgi:hypothetical protein